MVDSKKLQVVFFFILFSAVILLSYFVFHPFLQVICLSAIFSVLLEPFYKKTLAFFRGHKTIAAIAVISVMLVFIAVPIYFLGTQILDEAGSLYVNVQQNGSSFLDTITALVQDPIRNFFPTFVFDLRSYLASFAGYLLADFGPIISGTMFVFLEMLLTLVTLYYFLKNGDDFVQGLVKLSPLEDRYDRSLLSSMSKTVNSVLRGSLLIAFIQGVLVGTGLFIFQVPNPALWGSVAALCALIPGMGTALVTIPSIAYLFIVHNTEAGIGLTLWAIFFVGTIDNVLAPYLFMKGTEVHPLFVFFSVIGGIAYFGPMGFLFGPIILSAFVSLLHIYHLFILQEGDENLTGG